MTKRILFLIVVSLTLTSNCTILLGQGNSVSSNTDPLDSVRVDYIEISKNWMTWERIIRKELLFKEGEWVQYGRIDTSLNRVWNIGNFADVSFTIREDSNKNVMEIEALDALQIYPVFSIDHSSKEDFNYRLGVGDENFLGSNSKLKIVWDKKPTGTTWDFSFKLPRQLMYKNMTVGFGTKVGLDTKVFYDRIITEEEGKKVAEYESSLYAPYRKTDIYVSIGNPWHLDYRYRFSPNLSLRYKKDVFSSSNTQLDDFNPDILVEDKTYQFVNLSFSESVGKIDTKRHRKNGYSLKASYNLFLGLKGTRNHHEFSYSGDYHRTVSPLIQISTSLKVGHSTADDQYRFIKGSKEVLGLRLGEIYGKHFYSAYAGTHFTWLNTKWLSLENAWFLNWGNGAESITALFGSKQKFSVGTGLNIRLPMVSWINFRFTFMYAGPGGEWFKFNM